MINRLLALLVLSGLALAQIQVRHDLGTLSLGAPAKRWWFWSTVFWTR